MDLKLRLFAVSITRTVLSLLVQLLNQPLPREHSQVGEDSKWNEVMLYCCTFEKEPTNVSETTNNEPNYCTPAMMHILTSALVNRTRKLIVAGSDPCYVVSCLTTNPDLDQIELYSLTIADQTPWRDDVSARLGDMIQRCTHLRELRLRLVFDKAPSEMFESFANAIRIQYLGFPNPDPQAEQDREQMLSKLVCGGVTMALWCGYCKIL